jgi:sec-independent protein translocase protein TatA
MFNQFGPLELILVLVIVLVIFGPKRLPTLGRQLGRGMREFKDSITGDKKDDEDDDERPAITTATAGSSSDTAAADAALGRPQEQREPTPRA